MTHCNAAEEEEASASGCAQFSDNLENNRAHRYSSLGRDLKCQILAVVLQFVFTPFTEVWLKS